MANKKQCHDVGALVACKLGYAALHSLSEPKNMIEDVELVQCAEEILGKIVAYSAYEGLDKIQYSKSAASFIEEVLQWGEKQVAELTSK